MTGEGDTLAQSSPSRVGERLRAAREQQGFSLEEVAQRTRVPMRHLRMIEDGDYEGLPAPTYSAGFVKTYARLLGLDGQTLSEQFRGEVGAAVVRPHRPTPYEPADPRRTPPLGIAVVALLVALVVGLVFLYWRGSHDQAAELAARGVAPAVAASAPALSGVPGVVPVGATPAGSVDGPVTIAATQDVWIKVWDGGKTLFLGTLKPGNTLRVPTDAVDPMLTTGRPGVTAITVGATPIPTIGNPDQAAHAVSLKAGALLARVATPAPAFQPSAGAATPVENIAGPA